MAAVIKNAYKAAYEYASASLNRTTMISTLAAVQKNGLALESAPESQDAGQFDVVLACVQNNGWFLEYAGHTWRSNGRIVRAAVKDTLCNLRHYAFGATTRSFYLQASQLQRLSSYARKP